MFVLPYSRWRLMIISLSDSTRYGIAQPVNSSASAAFLCKENMIQLLPSDGGVEMVGK